MPEKLEGEEVVNREEGREAKAEEIPMDGDPSLLQILDEPPEPQIMNGDPKDWIGEEYPEPQIMNGDPKDWVGEEHPEPQIMNGDPKEWLGEPDTAVLSPPPLGYLGRVVAGELTVKVHRATNLEDKDMRGKSDPYAVVEYDGTRLKSDKVENLHKKNN